MGRKEGYAEFFISSIVPETREWYTKSLLKERFREMI